MKVSPGRLGASIWLAADYIELDRRFSELRQSEHTEDVAYGSYNDLHPEFRTVGSVLSWEDLLRSKRVVVLGEPGSGKTYEFEAKASNLVKQNSFAWFVRLDEALHKPLAQLLEPGLLRLLQQWQKSSEPGFLFLDSVDEAKLASVSHFYTSYCSLAVQFS
jgi:hypothetical protein